MHYNSDYNLQFLEKSQNVSLSKVKEYFHKDEFHLCEHFIIQFILYLCLNIPLFIDYICIFRITTRVSFIC